jgi:putative membrane protein
MVAGWVMSAWDAVMDPGMAASGNWVWEQGGGYFGVPLRNYFGWLLTTFLVFLGAGLLWRGKDKAAEVIDSFAALPILIYAFYALSYVTPREIPALQVVGLFAMGFPALLATIQVWARRI